MAKDIFRTVRELLDWPDDVTIATPLPVPRAFV
jgi:hypothetical protein